MSVDNIFNNPAKQAKLRDLKKTFDPLIQGIRDLDIEDEDGEISADAITKRLVKVYVKRRRAIEDATVDLDADITFVPRTRAKKQVEEQAAAAATTGTKIAAEAVKTNAANVTGDKASAKAKTGGKTTAKTGGKKDDDMM